MKMTYFGPKQSDYPGEGNTFYVRIEEIEEKGKETVVITAKGDFAKEGNMKKCKEISIPVTDANQCKEFFGVCKIPLKGSKTKTRHLFNIDDLIVTVDEWDQVLGNRIDIEGFSEDKIHAFAERIKHFCEE